MYRIKEEKLYRSELYVAKEEGIEISIKQGLEQGTEQKSIEIVKNMLAKNIDINVISEVTNLSIEEIKQLI